MAEVLNCYVGECEMEREGLLRGVFFLAMVFLGYSSRKGATFLLFKLDALLIAMLAIMGFATLLDKGLDLKFFLLLVFKLMYAVEVLVVLLVHLSSAVMASAATEKHHKKATYHEQLHFCGYKLTLHVS